MSYILYINDNLIELSEANAIAQTKQVNDLARLDNRQTSMTNKFTAPLTANNIRAMEKVYLVGNQSNIPYQKNETNLFDAESGKCLIYKGWANIIQTSKKGYEIYIYDGIIDFYRAIENKTLTDVGIAGLNHAKSITNIIASWNNALPYFYAIADYNGKNKFITTGGTPIEINTDYQVPSARISYIWERIHQFAGFTYSGAYFTTQDFLNLFMTFPKPVPALVPHRVLIYAGTFNQRYSTYWYYTSGGAYLSQNSPLRTLPRENFTTPYATVTNNNAQTAITAGGFVYDHNYINILITGTYSIDIPWDVTATFVRRDSANTVVESGVTNTDPTGNFNTYIFVATAGDKVALIVEGAAEYIIDLAFDWSINRIDGYEANFEEALVDFKATEFVKEIIQRGGLTAFKDKYNNNIEYLTMDEILRTVNIEDWSDKFQYKDVEKYRIGNYAKQNNFKYKYNTENETHNDGYITINDDNLNDSADVLVSKIYSPEKYTNEIAGRQSRVFKIWEKELQDDSTIKYKDLSGRYYFLRFEKITNTSILASEKLNTEQSVNEIAFATFANLKFNEIITRNYSAIATILNKAKIIDGYFYLKPTDIEAFTFKSLIYIEQLSSYYLVNKILNFIKGKVTKCELIEVDYKNTSLTPIQNTATYITIDSFTVVGCVVTVTYSTDATLNTPINLVCGLNNFGLPVLTPPDPIYGHTEVIYNTAVTNTVSFTLQAGAYYLMYMAIQNIGSANINSNQVGFENVAGCVIVSPTTLVITAVTLLSSDALTQTFKIDFTTDAVLPRNIYVQNYKTPVPIDPNNIYAGSFGGWSGYTDNGTASALTITHGVNKIFGNALKLQIKIGSKESNIFTI